MKLTRTTVIAILSTLGMLALILLQVRWLQQSSALISEQFEQKVSSALSTAILKLKDPSGISHCEEGPDGCYILPQEKEAELKCKLTGVLACYDLPTRFEFQIVNEQDSPVKDDSPYCCSLRHLDEKLEDKMVVIAFLDKPKYIAEKMGLMILFSALILLLLSGIFIYINLALLKQKRATERNTDFFNNMAHEFKTPLTNIILATKMLKKRQKEEPFLDVIQKEGERLKWQVERVLHLAKMEHGGYEIEKQYFLLQPQIEQLLSTMYARLQEEKAVVNMDISEGLQIYADPFHLSNSIRNLLDNALKYCKAAPIINISAKETQEGVVLQIADNGIGISKANQDFIFKKFQRVGSGDLHDHKGFGLGLAYVQKVMELHAGFIRIVSELNKGSRFDLVLPRPH
ncbi:MAG: HAMP domain-containing sensor histidine kinase [Bacteroidota bacterium]